MRRASFLVAAALALAACDGSAGGPVTVGTASTPPAPADMATGSDAAVDAGGGIDADVPPAPPCPPTASLFAVDLALGAADSDYVYLFGDHKLYRVPFIGSGFGVVAEGVDSDASSAIVDVSDVYWLAGAGSGQPALMRAPKSGGSASELGPGGGAPGPFAYVVGDPIYFLADGAIASMPADGHGPVTMVTASGDADYLTANSHTLVWIGASDDFALHTRPLPAAPSARSMSPADADDQYAWFAIASRGELRRYTIADGSFIVLTRWSTGYAGSVRVAGDSVYVDLDARLERIAREGSHSDILVDDLQGPWMLAGDTIFFTHATDVWRVCR